jgi:hypothetical protein
LHRVDELKRELVEVGIVGDPVSEECDVHTVVARG